MAITADFLGALVGLLFTLLTLSYLLGDSPLFKVAVYIFVGVSAGYAASVAWHQALAPLLFSPLLSAPMTERLILVAPLVLSVLLLMKISPYLSHLGTVPMGFLVGVAAAVAVGGAVLGTLLPQIAAAIAPFGLYPAVVEGYGVIERLFTGIITLVGTISTLVFFHFGAKNTRDGKTQRNRLIEWIAWIGRVFIAITFGVLFAGVYAAALTALINRLDSIISFFR